MGKKFVASYSGGKDSILAIHRALAAGMEPIALITTYNTDRKRSWFHGIPEQVLESVSKSLGIPVWLIKTSGEEYTQNFEKTLTKAHELGAEVCVYGDIDIEEHNVWCSERCANVGMKAMFPLWGENRRSLVEEVIATGYTANFTVIDTKRMSDSFLGGKLTAEVVAELAAQGVDCCGENGEYHTFVSAGPIFKQPVEFKFGEKLIDNGYAVMPILPL